jgi:hypothetical protein
MLPFAVQGWFLTCHGFCGIIPDAMVLAYPQSEEPV